MDGNSNDLSAQRDAALARLGALTRRGRELVGDRDAELRIWQNDCAVLVHELAGGSKAHWLSRAYSNALLARSADGAALTETTPAEIVDRVLGVLQQATESLRTLGESAAGSVAGEPAPRRFDFVHTAVLRPVLEQAFAESGRALDEGRCAESLLTTCGIIEAIITDALRLAPDDLRDRSGHARVEEMSFSDRIAAAEQAGLIHGGCARLPAVARAYRDLPPEAAVSERDARVARQVLNVVLRDLDPGR